MVHDQPAPRAHLFAFELLAGIKSMSLRAVAWLVDGDQVDINWVIDMQLKNRNEPTRLDELAHQYWEGDRIVTERFYYDPASLRSQ